MFSRCALRKGAQPTIELCACVVLFFIIGCGGGSVAPKSSATGAADPPGASAPGNSSGSATGGSNGSANTGGSSSGGSSNGGSSGGAAVTGFLYVGLDDAYSYYGNIPHTGQASIAGFSVASDGFLQATAGSPYASPSMALVANAPASTLYAASGQTLNVDRINADGSLTTTSTLTAQPLSPSIGIYEALSFDQPAQLLYAIANHGSGDEFFEIYKTSSDGSLVNDGSQQGSVNIFPLSFTADGKRAYEPFCYHLGSEIFGWNVGADGKLVGFNPNASIPSIDANYQPCPHVLAISPDGKSVAAPLNSVTSSSAALAIWTVNSDGALSTAPGSPYPRTAQASDIAWDSSSRYIAIAAKDGLWIYSFSAGSPPVPVGGGPIITGPIDHIAFSKAGTLLFATNASAQSVYVFTFSSSSGVAVPAAGSPHKMSLAAYGLAIAER